MGIGGRIGGFPSASTGSTRPCPAIASSPTRRPASRRRGRWVRRIPRRGCWVRRIPRRPTDNDRVSVLDRAASAYQREIANLRSRFRAFDRYWLAKQRYDEQLGGRL